MKEKTIEPAYGKKIKGVKLNKLNVIIAIATAIISLFLLVGIYFSFVNYKDVLQTSNDYVEWQQPAHKMRETSDYLTEEVRDFVETGDTEYLQKYFDEAEKNKNREKTLKYIEAHFPNSTLYTSIKNAFDDSFQLMETEYYSMRLKIEALEMTESERTALLATYPKVQAVELSAADAVLSPTEKDERARHILFDNDYIDAKARITANTNACINQLAKELETRQDSAEGKMRFAFTFEVIMIIVFIGYSIFVIVITSRQVFRPIMRSIPLIENDSPMPVEGAHELRILANTYNTMYNLHHKETSSLKFKTEHDALTGALNRRALDKLQAAAGDGKVAFLIVDVDNFKKVNDNFGHPVGDKLLKKVVSYLRLYLRSDDRIFRIGGDEFAVVMFGVDKTAKNSIQKKVDGINKNLAEETSADLPRISLSVGVAFGNVIDQKIITNADNALYKRKQSGKAGVTFHE